MLTIQRCSCALLLLASAQASLAQAAALGVAPAAASAAARPAAVLPQKQVIEDDKVRIEETRLRGQAQRITVQNKVGSLRGYEIILPPAGKDPSQDRGAAGKRTWSVLDF